MLEVVLLKTCQTAMDGLLVATEWERFEGDDAYLWLSGMFDRFQHPLIPLCLHDLPEETIRVCVPQALKFCCLHELIAHCLQINIQDLTPPVLFKYDLPVPEQQISNAWPHIQCLHEGPLLPIYLQHPIISTKFIIRVPISIAEAEQIGEKSLHGQGTVVIVPSEIHEGIIGTSTVSQHPNHLGKELS